MRQISEETWQVLRGRVISNNRMYALTALEGSVSMAQVALDSSGSRHLLIPYSESLPPIEDNESRGLIVSTRFIRLENHEPNLYLDICCNSPEHYSIFNIVGGEIVELLEDTTVSPGTIVLEVLERWRSFWKNQPNQALSENQILGLFGELWFLLNWLLPCRRDSADYWTGPHGSRHDFQFPSFSFEVKTTSSVREIIHRISGLEQLEPVSKIPLFLYSLKVREDVSAENNIPLLVNNILPLLDSRQKNIFRESLSLTGYSQVHQEVYSQRNFSVIQEGIYLVNENFPSLCRFDLPENKLSGIVKIEYEISLSNLQPLITAPAEPTWREVINGLRCRI